MRGMQTQNVLGHLAGTPAHPSKPGGPLPLNALSRDAQAVFAKWGDYISALGHKPGACYVTRQQAEKLNKSITRKFGQNSRCTDFTHDGLPIVVTDS
jgi:hypothetical protein